MGDCVFVDIGNDFYVVVWVWWEVVVGGDFVIVLDL